MRSRLAIGLLGASLLLSCGPREPAGKPAPEPPREAPPAEGQPPEAPLAELLVTVYFPSRGGDTLRGEARQIFDTASPVERAKQILSDLVEGPSGPQALPALPPGTRLRQVFVLDSGLAWADFSSELRDSLGGGSAAELMAVYSIVNSLALNVPEIHRVGILVEGRPVETLNGHLDLRRPLLPDASLVERGGGEAETVI